MHLSVDQKGAKKKERFFFAKMFCAGCAGGVQEGVLGVCSVHEHGRRLDHVKLDHLLAGVKLTDIKRATIVGYSQIMSLMESRPICRGPSVHDLFSGQIDAQTFGLVGAAVQCEDDVA